jgi:hypothetical protein
MEEELYTLLKEFVEEFKSHTTSLTTNPKLIYAIRRGNYASAGQTRFNGAYTINTGICFHVGVLYTQLHYLVITLNSTRKIYDYIVERDLWHNKYESYEQSLGSVPSAIGCILGGFLARNFELNSNQFVVSEQSFEIAFSELSKFFKKNFIEYEWHIHLQGVTGSVDKVDLTNNVSIIRADVRMAQLYSINYTGNDLFSTIEMFEDDYLLKIKIQFPKSYYTQFGAAKASQIEKFITKKWQNFILLTLPGSLRFGKMMIFSEDWPVVYWHAIGPFGTETVLALKHDLTTLSDDVIKKLKQAADIFETIPNDAVFDKKIIYAIERLTKAKASANIDDRVVELSIALEFLLSTSTTNEVTLQLTLKLIKLLYEINHDETIHSKIKKFYTLRSKIIHGNDKVDPNETNKTIIDFAELLIQKATLRLMQLNRTHPYKTIEEALTNSLYITKSLSELLPINL